MKVICLINPIALQLGVSLASSIANVGLAKQQDSLNYDRFLENRKYNEPKQQVDRLVAAGLNPNGLAQQIGGNAVSSDAPPMSPPFSQVSPVEVSQASLAESNIEVNKALAGLYRSQTTGLDIENAIKPFIVKENLRKAKLDNRLSELSIEFTEENNGIMLDMNRESLNQIKANIGYIEAQTEKVQAEKGLVLEQIKVAETQEDLNKALAKYNIAYTDYVQNHLSALTDSQKVLTDSEKLLTDQNTKNAQQTELNLYKDYCIKSVEAFFANENKRIYKDVGFTSDQTDIYGRYAQIKANKGTQAAEKFLNDMFYIAGENEASISSMKFFYGNSGSSNNPYTGVVEEVRRSEGQVERGVRKNRHYNH